MVHCLVHGLVHGPVHGLVHGPVHGLVHGPVHGFVNGSWLYYNILIKDFFYGQWTGDDPL